MKYKPNSLPLKITVFLCSILFNSCGTGKIISLEFMDSYEIDGKYEVLDSLFGGISGIDYDKNNDIIYLITDDRSEHGPARFYEARVIITNNDLVGIDIKKKFVLSDRLGAFFKRECADFESIRYSARQEQWIVGNEGGNNKKAGISFFDSKGYWNGDFSLDPTYVEDFRPNKSIESLALSLNERTLFYATEAPLVSDGPEASYQNKGLLRIICADVPSEKTKETWLYQLERIPQKTEVAPPWGGIGSDNGLSELLALDEKKLLALERSGAYQKNGNFNFICRLFLVKRSKEVLTAEASLFKTKKIELLDFSKIPNGKANIEGMTFGPRLENNRTLLFVSDNNFNKSIPTRFFLFKIKESNSGKN